MRKLTIISAHFPASASAQAQSPDIGSVLSVIATMSSGTGAKILRRAVGSGHTRSFLG